MPTVPEPKNSPGWSVSEREACGRQVELLAKSIQGLGDVVVGRAAQEMERRQ